jgi:hypothetical protein
MLRCELRLRLDVWLRAEAILVGAKQLANAFCAPFAEEQARPRLDVLRAVHEGEVAGRALASAEDTLACHRGEPCSLSHGADVYDGLVIELDRSRVVEDQDLSREGPAEKSGKRGQSNATRNDVRPASRHSGDTTHGAQFCLLTSRHLAAILETQCAREIGK